MITLVTGGARSGKSSFAEKLAGQIGTIGYYVATAQIFDEEMAQRISLHQSDRQNGKMTWITYEEPLHLTKVLEEVLHDAQKHMPPAKPVVLIDCLTLWLSNWFMELDVEQTGTAALREVFEQLFRYLQQYELDVVLVSNEVGNGIVPINKLSRMYRDEAGIMNQLIAKLADQVFLVTVGIPIELKHLSYMLEE